MRLLRLATFSLASLALSHSGFAQIGSEKSVPDHLADGDEYTISLKKLVKHGGLLFNANWTDQEGGGRPGTKGTGGAITDGTDPLEFPRNMNRISAPDANSCGGCHNLPRSGGGADFAANVFVLGQRFDFATFDSVPDGFNTKGTSDELGNPVNIEEIANSRNSLGMFGSGYIEMLARQITVELQHVRDGIGLGETAALIAYGIDFGSLTRNGDDTWDTSAVEGLGRGSLLSSSGVPPTLVIQPFHQAGAVVSLRLFTNNAMNHHHGIQPTERFGVGTDPDGDSFVNEMTVADITAVSVWQATLAVPGRVIPKDKDIEEAVLLGEQLFVDTGCSDCHIPYLPLVDKNWNYSEPSPFNPAGNLRISDLGPEGPLVVNLNDKKNLPVPRLKSKGGVTWVPAFTDFKLHDITSGPMDPNREQLDMHEPAGSVGFFAGNGRFITRKLWGVANEPPYFHHGKFSTMRTAIENHAGEAAAQKAAFDLLTASEQDAIIEFLKTLQVLPEGTKNLIIDDKGKKKKKWPDFPYDRDQHLPSAATR